MSQVQRRQFLLAAGGVATLLGALTPLASFAQSPKKKAKVALLQPGAQATSQHLPDAVRDEMTKRGYVEGRDIEYEVVFANNDATRFDPLAQQLVQGKPDVIFTSSNPSIKAVMRATNTIPIVMATSANPVGNNFITSLAHPGGTVTGIATQTEDLVPKLVQLAQETIPNVKRIGWMVTAAADIESYSRKFDSVTRTLGLTPTRYVVTLPEEIEPAFLKMKRDRVGMIIFSSEPLYYNQRVLIGQVGLRQRVATIGGWQENVAAGALLTYGPNLVKMYRQAASHVDRILKGAHPATLPVEMPTIYDLSVNAKTARALALKIPQSVLLRADEVIE